MALFEVFIWNRVVRISDGRPIGGSQGQGFSERILVVADSEDQAIDLAFGQIWDRPILGIGPARRGKLEREIKIHGIRRK